MFGPCVCVPCFDRVSTKHGQIIVQTLCEPVQPIVRTWSNTSSKHGSNTVWLNMPEYCQHMVKILSEEGEHMVNYSYNMADPVLVRCWLCSCGPCSDHVLTMFGVLSVASIIVCPIAGKVSDLALRVFDHGLTMFPRCSGKGLGPFLTTGWPRFGHAFNLFGHDFQLLIMRRSYFGHVDHVHGHDGVIATGSQNGQHRVRAGSNHSQSIATHGQDMVNAWSGHGPHIAQTWLKNVGILSERGQRMVRYGRETVQTWSNPLRHEILSASMEETKACTRLGKHGVDPRTSEL